MSCSGIIEYLYAAIFQWGPHFCFQNDDEIAILACAENRETLFSLPREKPRTKTNKHSKNGKQSQLHLCEMIQLG